MYSLHTVDNIGKQPWPQHCSAPRSKRLPHPRCGDFPCLRHHRLTALCGNERRRSHAGSELRLGFADGKRTLCDHAPTRRVWVPLGGVYSALVVLFGCGVWTYRDRSRWLGRAGTLLILNGFLSLYWPLMHLRGVESSLTDTLHIVLAGVTVLLMISVIVVAALSFGRRFRTYSWVTLTVLLATGVFLSGLDGPRIAENLPTPWIGLWERISIGVYMAWVIVLWLISLLRETNDSGQRVGVNVLVVVLVLLCSLVTSPLRPPARNPDSATLILRVVLDGRHVLPGVVTRRCVWASFQ